MGNLNAIRDWGHSRDYKSPLENTSTKKKLRIMWLQQDNSVREFVNEAFKYINVKIKWIGKGIKEKFTVDIDR